MINNGILIVFFTRSGNTQKIANMIQKKAGGNLFQIEPVDPYPPAYNAVTEQAKKEIRANFKPALKSKVEHLESYKTVFVGSPNWWNTIAPPIATFLSENDFSGKTIPPFCTHGGGGLGQIQHDIAKLCPQATVLNSLEIYGSGAGDTDARVSAWLKKAGLNI